MKYLLMLPLMFGLSCSSLKTNQASLSDINLSVKEVKLDNGLTALIVPDHKLPIFSLYIFYKVGGKNEVPGITGASHFLEHMMFKGAKKFGKNTIDFIIEGSGGSTNAYTTADQTVYYENLPTPQLEQMLEIEADRMENLLLDKDDFEKERAVVLEERKMRYENSPRGQLYLGLMNHLFEGTPYGRSVIGDIPDLKSVTREQIYEYFKKFYAPNNAVIVIAGDVDTDDATKFVKKYFGSIKASTGVSEAHASLKDSDFVPNLKKDKVVKLKGESPNPIFMMGYPTYKAGDVRGYPLDILSSIIGAGKSSSLVNDYILTKKPVATSIYAAHQSLDMSGFFFVGGELVQGVSLDNFKEDLKKKLVSYCETEITPKNIQKVKNNYQTDLYESLDTNAGMARFLGDRQLVFGDWKTYKEELKQYEKVTVDDVKRACLELSKTPSVFISVWNQHK